MTGPKLIPALFATALACAPSTSARAEALNGKTLTVQADLQSFDAHRGTLATGSADLHAVTRSGSWKIGLVTGRRESDSYTASGVGGSVMWHRKWSRGVDTTTEGFVASSDAPFARASVAQNLALRVGARTAVTVGERWARYPGGEDVWFTSGEVRQSFRGGSVAYRLTWVVPTTGSGYASHLISLTYNDSHGRGQSQLWLSSGQASLKTSLLHDDFHGHDWGIQARRVQPLTRNVSALVSVGLSSYDLPAGTIRAVNVGLGLSFHL